MLKNWLKILLALSLCFIMLSSAYGQKIKFKVFDIENGLPNNFINTIDQDKNGYLWIGTSEGLAKYNGLNIEQFKTKDGLSDDFISVTYIDNQGTMWLGHSNGNVSYYNKGRFDTIGSGLNTIITGITEDNVGNKWISTQTEGIYRIEEETHTVKVYEMPNNIISSIVCLETNIILIGTNNGLYKRKIINNNLSKIESVNGFPSFNVTSIIKKNNKSGVWVTTSEAGLYNLSISDDNKITVFKVGDNIGLNLENVQSVFEDNEQNLWVSTFGLGICKLNYSLDKKDFIDIKFYNEENGLISNYVKTIFQDRESNIWIGTYGFGLAQKMEESFLFYSFDENVYSNNIFSIIIDKKQFLWLGTAEGLMQIDLRTEKVLEFYNADNRFINDIVTSLCFDNSGNLYVGTSKNGLYYFNTEEKEFEKIIIGGDALSNMINKIAIDNDTIWAATNGGIIKLHKNLISVTNTTNGLKHNVVNDLCFNKTKDKLYFASSITNMVSFIQKDSVISTPIGSAYDLYEFISVDIDENGSLWLATTDYGIIRWDSLVAVKLSPDMGLKSNYCYNIIVDNQNNIWVSHRGGLSVVMQENEEIKTYGINDGISSNLNKNSAFLDNKGNLWFGTNNGLIKHVPENREKTNIPPILNINSIKINNKEVDFSKMIKLKYGTYQFVFNFTGISLKDPQGVTYKYMLEGHDPSFISSNTNKNIVYNNLTDGDFYFKIYTCNSEGICTEKPVVVNIFIDKPFWRKTWVIITFIVLIIIITFFLVYTRFNQLKKRKLWLEDELWKRTSEIVAQKHELEVKNQNITDSLEYALSIQRSILPNKSYVQKYFPDSFIFYKPKDIVSGDFYRFDIIPNKNKFLFFCADCTGHGIPGAFMSMIGNTLIKDIITQQNYKHIGDILNKLNTSLLEVFIESDKDKRNDGMDISICEIDKENNKLNVSSANRTFVTVINNKITWHKGSRSVIGGHIRSSRNFETITFDIEKGDIIYMFTDGYVDQFGGKSKKKFKTHNFKKLISEIYMLPMEEQFKQIIETHEKWILDYGSTDETIGQIDDILVLGIKI